LCFLNNEEIRPPLDLFQILKTFIKLKIPALAYKNLILLFSFDEQFEIFSSEFRAKNGDFFIKAFPYASKELVTEILVRQGFIDITGNIKSLSPIRGNNL
jgi:hypothetical protein